MDNTLTQKGKSVESYTRIYVATILVLWKSICDDSKAQSKKKKDEEEKRIKEEKKESDDIAKGITLVEDEELEIEEIAKERKEGIELIKNTRFKKKYEEYNKCENELKTDLDAMQKELTTIYDECEEIISTQDDKNNVNKKKKEDLEAQIVYLIDDTGNKYKTAKNKWDGATQVFDTIQKTVISITDIINNGPVDDGEEMETIKDDAINDETTDIDITRIAAIPKIINTIKNITTKISEIENISYNFYPQNEETYKIEKLKNLNLKTANFNNLIDSYNQPAMLNIIQQIKSKKTYRDALPPANPIYSQVNIQIDNLETEKTKYDSILIEIATTFTELKPKLKKIKSDLIRKQSTLDDNVKIYKDIMLKIKNTKKEIKDILGKDDRGIANNIYFSKDNPIDIFKGEMHDSFRTIITKEGYQKTSQLYKKLTELELHKETERGTDTNPICEAINADIEGFKNNYNPQVFEIIKNEIFKDEYYKYDYFDKKIIDDMLDKQIPQEGKKENIKLIKEYAQQHIEVIEEYIEKTEKNQRKISTKNNENNETKEGLTYYLDKKLNDDNTFNSITDIFKHDYDIREDKNVVSTDDKKEDWIIINEYLKNLKKIRRNETLDPYKIEDIFNKDKKYEKDNYFLLTKDKQEMYEKFSDYIKDPAANIQENNNFEKFNTEIKKNILESLDEDSLEEQTTNPGLDNFIDSFINIQKQKGGVKNVIKAGATGATTAEPPAETPRDWIVHLLQPEKQIEPGHKNYKKWIERKKKLVQLRKNLKKNISEIFKKRFSLIKLVYFVIKNSNEINNWKILVKNNKIKSNRILTNSVKKRIKLIQKINDKMYTDLLEKDNKKNNKIKLNVAVKLLEYIYNKKECWDEFDNDISNIKNVTITRREIFSYLNIQEIEKYLKYADWDVISKLIKDFLNEKQIKVFNLIFRKGDKEELINYLIKKAKETSDSKDAAKETQEGKIFPNFGVLIKESMEFLSSDEMGVLVNSENKINKIKNNIYQVSKNANISLISENIDEESLEMFKLILIGKAQLQEITIDQLLELRKELTTKLSDFETALTNVKNKISTEITNNTDFDISKNFKSFMYDISKLSFKNDNVTKIRKIFAEMRRNDSQKLKNLLTSIVHTDVAFEWDSTEPFVVTNLKPEHVNDNNLEEMEKKIGDRKNDTIQILEKWGETSMNKENKLYEIEAKRLAKEEEIEKFKTTIKDDNKNIEDLTPHKVGDGVDDLISFKCLKDLADIVKKKQELKEKTDALEIKINGDSEKINGDDENYNLVAIQNDIDNIYTEEYNNRIKDVDDINADIKNFIEKDCDKSKYRVDVVNLNNTKSLFETLKELVNTKKEEIKDEEDKQKYKDAIDKLSETLNQLKDKVDEITKDAKNKSADENNSVIVETIQKLRNDLETKEEERQAVLKEIINRASAGTKKELATLEAMVDKLKKELEILVKGIPTFGTEVEEVENLRKEQKAQLIGLDDQLSRTITESRVQPAEGDASATQPPSASPASPEEKERRETEAEALAATEAEALAATEKVEAEEAATAAAAALEAATAAAAVKAATAVEAATAAEEAATAIETSAPEAAEVDLLDSNIVDNLIRQMEGQETNSINGGGTSDSMDNNELINNLFIKIAYLLFRILNNYYTPQLKEDEVTFVKNLYKNFHSPPQWSDSDDGNIIDKITAARKAEIKSIALPDSLKLSKLVETISSKIKNQEIIIENGVGQLPIPATQNLLVKIRDIDDNEINGNSNIIPGLDIKLSKPPVITNNIVKCTYLQYDNILIGGNIYSSMKTDGNPPEVKKTGWGKKDYETMTANHDLNNKTVYTYGWTGSGKTHLLRQCGLIKDADQGFEFVLEKNEWKWIPVKLEERKTHATVKNFASSRSHFLKNNNGKYVMDLAGLEEPFSFTDYSNIANLFIEFSQKDETDSHPWETYTSKEEGYDNSKKFKDRFLEGHNDLNIKSAKKIINLEEIRSYLGPVNWKEINTRLNQLGKIEKTISILGDDKNIVFDTMINMDTISKINDLDNLLKQPLATETSVTKSDEEKKKLIEKIQNELNAMDTTEFWKGGVRGAPLPLSKLTIDEELILQGGHYDNIMNLIGWKLKYSEYRGDDPDARNRESIMNGLFLYWYIYYLGKDTSFTKEKYQGYSAGGVNAGKWDLIKKMFLNGTGVQLELKQKYTKISDIFKNITPEGQFSAEGDFITVEGVEEGTIDIKKNSIIGEIYKEKEKLIDNTYKEATANAEIEVANIEQTKSELRYYYLLILNYVNRIYEGYKINETLQILQLITKKRSQPNLLIGYEPGFSLLELFCYDYLSQPVKEGEERPVPGYSNDEPFLNVVNITLQKIFDEDVMGILALDIKAGREKELPMKEEEYDTLAINSIFQYFNTYNIMSVVEKESDFFKYGISDIAKLFNRNVDDDFYPKQLNTSIRSSIESMYSFATGLIKPYFVKQENKLLNKSMINYNEYGKSGWGVVGKALGKKQLTPKNDGEIQEDQIQGGRSNKIINQNIRVKELSKLKKLYKKLNKK